MIKISILQNENALILPKYLQNIDLNALIFYGKLK
jgi:hypothetical protein